MARSYRIEYPGALHHVIARGNNKQDIFVNNDMRSSFLLLLRDVKKKYKWKIHTYCLMDNHYHLLVETKDPNLFKGMQSLNSRYAQLFNKVFDRSGHLFQGRYKSFLVEKDDYLLNVVIYIIMNPVRAGMVEHPRRWPWSSFNSILGGKDDGISSSWVLGIFSNNLEKAREYFCERIRSVIYLEGLTPVVDMTPVVDSL